MRNLTLLFVALLITISCSSSTGSDDDQWEPKKIGNWYMNIPSLAEYVGVQSQQKYKPSALSSEDTLVIEQPGDYELRVVRDTADTGVRGVILYFEDHSAYIDSIRPGATQVVISDEIMHGENFVPARSLDVYKDYIEYRVEILYDCDAEFSDDNLFIETYTEDLDLFKVYNFKTKGLQQVFKEVSYACN